MKIEWRSIYINGKKSRYKISNTGIVYNVDTCRVQKPTISNSGYYRVLLSYKGYRMYVSIHRLVACYFIPNPLNLPMVNHKDGNKKNNNVWNLEWVTAKENVIHSYDHHLNHSGEDNIRSTISNEDAKKICELLISNEYTISEISKIVGCSKKVIRHIKSGDSWKRISIFYDLKKHTKKDTNVLYGENHGSHKLTKKSVMHVCELLQNTNKSLREIENITGVSYTNIRNIYYKSSWKSISDEYDFNTRRSSSHQ